MRVCAYKGVNPQSILQNYVGQRADGTKIEKMCIRDRGSGAAVFGVFADEAPAQAAKAALLRVYPQCWVLRPEAKGARVVGRG